MSIRSWRMALVGAGCAVVCIAALASTEVSPPTSASRQIEQLIWAGRYTEAEELARDFLPQIEGTTGSDSLETAAVLDSLIEALWRSGKSSLPETRELADRALEIREEQLGPSDLLVAESLVRKADVLLAMDRYVMAGDLLSRALQIYESVPGTNDLAVARTHNRLGKRYLYTGPIRDSEWHSALAVGIAESASTPDELALAEMLIGLAEFHIHSLTEDHRTAAEPLARRALEIRRRVLGEDHPLTAESAYQYGYILHYLHLHQEAYELVGGAIESLEGSVEPDHPRVAYYLQGLHHLQETLGDPVAAEESLWRSVAIFEKYPEIGWSAHTYDALGRLRHLQGDLVSARLLYEKALGISERTFGPESIETASVLNDLGRLETELGELDSARRDLERALQISTDLYGAMGEHAAVHYIALSRLYLVEQVFEKAESLARGACEITDCLEDSDHPLAVTAARELGIALGAGGKHHEARDVLSRGLVARKRAFDVRNHEVAENLIALADLMAELGHQSDAISMYEEAVSILEESYGSQHPRAAAARLKIADSLILSQQWEEAFDHALRAEEISREHSRLMLTGMSERVGLHYAANRPTGIDRIFSLLIERPESGSVQEGVEALIRSRALVLDEIAGRLRTYSTSASIGASRLMQDLTQSRKRLAYLTVRGPGDPDSLDAFQRALANATIERDRAERVFAEANRRFRLRQQRVGAGLSEVLAALPPGSGLVGFTRFRHSRFTEATDGSGGDTEPVPSYLAYVLRAGETGIELVELGKASEIDQLIEELRSEVDREAQVSVGSSASREQDYRSVAARLRELLWDPIEPYLTDLEQVFLVPDGGLHLVNLAALPIGQSEYLVEVGPLLHYLSAERDLMEDPTEVTGEGLLMIGNPDFDELAQFSNSEIGETREVTTIPAEDGENGNVFRGLRSSCESFQAMRFEPLPASEAEVNDVAQVWQSLESPAPVTTLLRGDALETSFKRLASGRQVLHLSTHGFYLGEDCPVYDFQSFRGGYELGGSTGTLESPLLRSGLAFAGANHRQAALPEADDGILTAEEVAAVDLQGVEWAVLSACESGLGELQTGEGVFGLRRAFAAAGARTLIMSLWPVDDEVTRDWMARLYRHRFVKGSTTVEAVHRANLDLLAARREAGLSTHPFYWAGFVAAGDWR